MTRATGETIEGVSLCSSCLEGPLPLPTMSFNDLSTIPRDPSREFDQFRARPLPQLMVSQIHSCAMARPLGKATMARHKQTDLSVECLYYDSSGSPLRLLPIAEGQWRYSISGIRLRRSYELAARETGWSAQVGSELDCRRGFTH